MFDEWVVTYAVHDTAGWRSRIILHKHSINEALADADDILTMTHAKNYTIISIGRSTPLWLITVCRVPSAPYQGS
jgi:hypothetical protein